MVAPRDGLFGANLGSTLAPAAGTSSPSTRARVRERTASRGFSRIPLQAIGLQRSTKRLLMLLFDAVALPLALGTAIALRSGGAGDLARLGEAFLWVSLVGIAALSLFGLYRTVTRFIGVRVVGRILAAITLSAVAFGFLEGLTHAWHVRYSAIAIYWAFALLFVAGGRAAVQYVCLIGLRTGTRKRIAIYGAGEAGARLSRFLIGGSEFEVVAFVDDHPSLHGNQINGIAVYPPEDLPALVINRRIDRVLLAMPSASRRRRREVLSDLEPLGVHVQSLPDLADIISGKARIDDLRDVDVADLLGRDPVPPDPKLIASCIRNKSVLVTGAGGSIGSELCRQILRVGPRRLVLCELSELALYNVERELREELAGDQRSVELVPLLGDAGDRRRMSEVLRTYDVQTVYHAAAYKHVPIVEHNIIQGLQNNVICTWSAAEAALEAGVERFVLVSTDKAVNPPNVMGASKRLAELVLQGMQERSDTTRFCMVRFGNVLGSSGSVVPLFREQIHRGGPVTVTHPQVVRYFMTIPEAAQLVIQAGSMATGGDVFVLDMGQPVRIDDLARRMINLMGLTVRDADHPDGDVEIRYTGLRAAEKLFEELLIGDNVGGTEHPMIMRAIEKRLPWSRIREILEGMTGGIDALDCKRVLATLQDAVAEYRPGSEIHDHVWSSRSAVATETDGKVTNLADHRRHLEGRSRHRSSEEATPPS
jgi:UDP-N-acetylglucosamine 4,6-dehydratase